MLILRLKRAGDLDATVAQALADRALALRERGITLLLVGMTATTMTSLERSGAAEILGPNNLFPARGRFFEALQLARDAANARLGERHTHGCPMVSAPRLDER